MRNDLHHLLLVVVAGTSEAMHTTPVDIHAEVQYRVPRGHVVRRGVVDEALHVLRPHEEFEFLAALLTPHE